MKLQNVFGKLLNDKRYYAPRTIIPFIILVVLIIQLGCAPFARLEGVIVDDRIAEGREWQGVVITREGKDLKTELDMNLSKGDRIRTDNNSSGVMLVSDSWEVIILPESEVEILNPRLFLEIGKAIVKTVKKVKEQFKVETEYVTAAVEGTEFLIEANPSGEMSIAVVEGKVTVVPKKESWSPVTLENRMQATIRPNETGDSTTTVSTQRLSSQRVNEIVRWREEAENTIRPRLPNLYNRSRKEARSTLEDLGFRVKEKSKITGKVRADQIYDQKPSANSRLKVGETVTIFVEAESVEVPNVVNMNIKEARSRIENAGLRVGRVNRKLKTEGEAETVISQSKKDGDLVKPNTKINLDIVRPAVYMPDLTNTHLTNVDKVFRELGLSKGEVKKELAVGQEDHVLRQDPAPGKLHPVDKAVNLWVVEPGIRVPNLIGISIEQARSRLNDSQLSLGQVSEVVNDKVKAGSITSQSPRTNTLVRIRSAVNINVAKASDNCYLEDLTGKSQKEAEAILRKAGFKWIIKTECEGTGVVNQSPKPGFIKCGSTVTIVVLTIC